MLTNDPPSKHYVPAENRRALELPSAFLGDAMGVLFDVTPLKSGQDTGIHRNRSWDTNGCLFSQNEADAFAAGRTKAQLENGAPLVMVHRYLRGGVRGRFGDVNIDRNPGAVNILDQGVRAESIQLRSTVQTIIMPKALIGFSPDRHPPLLSYPLQLPIGRVLSALFEKIFATLLSENSIDSEAFKQLIASLRLAVGSDRQYGDVRRLARDALSDVIRSHIERNLDDWDLSANAILRDFGVSRTSLYRMFEKDGGVRHFVTNRRLLRAVQDIIRHKRRRGDISHAAEKWGFSSDANFNRAVRREFGVPPGALTDVSAQKPFAGIRETRPGDFLRAASNSVAHMAQLRVSAFA